MERGILADLGLEVERIERDIDHCCDLGEAYFTTALNQEDNENQEKLMFMASATNFRRAAAHYLLLGNLEQSQEFFQKARDAYTRQQLPYALIMNLFSLDSTRNSSYLYQAIRRDSVEEIFSYELQLQLIYILLSSLVFDDIREISRNSQLRNIRDILESYRSYPIGILGIFLSNYLDVYEATCQYLDLPSDNYNQNNSISLEEALLPFFNSYNNSIRMARQNSYHWKRLAMPFHPADPDIFSILLIVGMVMRGRQESIFNTIERIPLQQQTNIFLNSILGTLSSII